MKYELINGKPVPAKLAPELRDMCRDDVVITSCLRDDAAVRWARSQGAKLSSQSELYNGFIQGRPGFNPANRPGQSTHELRSDGQAFPGPVGRPLFYWQVGVDCTSVATLRARAAKRGFTFTLTYPGNPRESHHGNFRKEPVLITFKPLKKGSKGRRVKSMTGRLAYLGHLTEYGITPKKGTGGFGDKVEAAVKKFQKNWHLTPDGVYGIQTHHQLLYAVRRKKKKRAAAAKYAAEKAKAQRAAAAAPEAKHIDAGKPTPNAAATQFSSKGAAFIAEFEGGQGKDGLFHPYWDANGNVWTQGFGHTENVHKSDKPWTLKEATNQLDYDMDHIYTPPVLKLGLKMTQPQLDAISSAVYNLGPGILDKGRSLGDALRGKKGDAAVAAALNLYVKDANGQKLAGLVRRRKAEAKLYTTGVYDTTP